MRMCARMCIVACALTCVSVSARQGRREVLHACLALSLAKHVGVPPGTLAARQVVAHISSPDVHASRALLN